MKKSVSLAVVLSTVACLAYGCGGDDDTTSSSPHAGSAGKGGGSGGKGGAGGSSAKGGKAGQGGASGRGGSAGAPRGGSSGRGGSAGASGAGQGGQCEEQPHGPLGECPGNDYSTVDTTCSFEDTCRELDCGGTWSQFDASGCRRPTCTASSQCDDDERCVVSALVGETQCFPGVFEQCRLDGCSCNCGISADCNTVAFCQLAADFPEAADCPISTVGCSGLPELVTMLGIWSSGVDTDDVTDLDAAVLACQTKAEHALAQCNGQGGEGGGGAGGQSGAGAGGQSGGGVGGR